MIDKFLPVDVLSTISTTSLKQKQTKNASRLCHMKKKIYSKKKSQGDQVDLFLLLAKNKYQKTYLLESSLCKVETRELVIVLRKTLFY